MGLGVEREKEWRVHWRASERSHVFSTTDEDAAREAYDALTTLKRLRVIAAVWAVERYPEIASTSWVAPDWVEAEVPA